MFRSFTIPRRLCKTLNFNYKWPIRPPQHYSPRYYANAQPAPVFIDSLSPPQSGKRPS